MIKTKPVLNWRTKRWLILVITLSYSAFLSSSNVMSKHTNEWTRDNGVEWISFGPGIIGACRRIDVTLGPGLHSPISIKYRDANFPAVRDWVKAHFENQLNYSPVKKCYQSVQFHDTITLYSSETGGDDSLLISAPLTTITLGVSSKILDKKLSELSLILSRKRRGGAKTN